MGKNYLKHQNNLVPFIGGSKGGGKGGGGGAPSEDPNSLFSTDILFLTTALGEGPLYRINPNGPQDIEIQDSAIDDLIDFETNTENTDKFKTLSTTGTNTQAPLDVFGEEIITPQQFASPVTLKKGNLAGLPASLVENQETSAQAWDALKFFFVINSLQKILDNGDVKKHSVRFKITIKNRILTGDPFQDNIVEFERNLSGKTNTPFKFTVKINIPEEDRSDAGYRFTVEKISNDDDSSSVNENLQLFGWFEVESAPQAYPRTAVIGYALKAVDEHQGGMPTFTSMVKGLLVKVPSNYNQPTLISGEIDWRHIEVSNTSRATSGYYLQAHAFIPQELSGTGAAANILDENIDITVSSGTSFYTSFSTTITQANSGYNGGQSSGSWNVIRENAGASGTASWTAHVVNDGATLRGTNTNKSLDVFVNDVKVVDLGSEGGSWGPLDLSAGDKVKWSCFGGTGGGGTINRNQSWTWTKDSSDTTIGYIANTGGGTSGSGSTQKATITNNMADGKILSLIPPTTGVTEEVLIANGASRSLTADLASESASWSVKAYVLPSGTSSAIVKTVTNPQLYIGTWDGTFVYSWTQNPVWIIYDLLTNSTYGLGIPEDYIDKYKFFQVAQYCDACDHVTGQFYGVDSLADGSYRNKPRNYKTSIRETLVGLPVGTAVKERRFILDTSITDENQAMDVINGLAATFRAALVYSMGKLTFAIDMPDEFPVAMFNETNIKEGSFMISGTKESDIISGVDVSYIEPTNHFKRETVRIDSAEANDGQERSTISNITSLDLQGVTRRSQALRFAQYQIAASKYQRRSVSFDTSTDALSLAPGDVISVAQQQTGVAYGYSGKISNNSPASVGNNSNTYLEHFTSPTIDSTFFTANTGAIALRVISLEDDKLDLFLLSNTNFTLTATDNVSTGIDQLIVNPIAKFDKDSKAFQAISSFNINDVPKKGDLWALGEIENSNNYYTGKAGKLFKITSISRDPDEETIGISAIEYISNVYTDSDTFIDYTPTAYTDILSPLSQPPAPYFNFDARPTRRTDGSVQIDGRLTFRNEGLGYAQDIQTEYFMSRPDGATLVNNTSAGSLTVIASNADLLTNNAQPAILEGKNGFQSKIGEIKLLCNLITTVDTEGGTLDGNVQLTLEGLNVAFDENFFKHVLEVNDPNVFNNLKGTDFVTIPVKEKTSAQGLLNFVGFSPEITALSMNIADFDKVNSTVKFENKSTNGQTLFSVIPNAPFYVTINQLLDARFYNNNSFYVSGSEFTYVTKGTLDSVNTEIPLEVRPRRSEFIRLFIDGVEKSSGQYTVNLNQGGKDANIIYATTSGETTFRAEVDHYTVPVIEEGDNVQAAFNNVFSVVGVSYDPTSANYNAALTANSVFRVELAESPLANLAGLTFVNLSPDPVGTLQQVSGNTAVLDFNTTVFPGQFNLGNNRVYNLSVGGEFEKLFLTNDLTIPNLPIGTTTIKARNKNILGRRSAFVSKSVSVDAIPIQKVAGLGVSESLYREQSGGVAVRATVSFDHISGQEVTDYEISYRMDNIDNVGTDDGGADLTSFNTVKVPATGVDDDGKVRFTVNGINRGTTSGTNFIVFRVVPLNKSLRGVTATISKDIVGKTAAPQNVFNFTGGQQTDQITLLWTYPRADSGDLLDLDLKEVVIRRAPGTVSIDLENFVASDPLVTVSAGTARKSIPIDTFGTFTYLARTRDTSGNFSSDVTGISITTTRPNRSTVVAAYNEDSPSVVFAGIANRNNGESNFPSFTDSTNGGTVVTNGNQTDNANGTASGFSAIGGSPTDLLVDSDGVYTTKIRDFGSLVTGSVFVEIEGTQQIKTQFTDTHETVIAGVTEASTTANVLKETNFGGIGTVLGVSNASVVNPRFDANNQTFMTGGATGNVFAIWNVGQYTGNVMTISAITKASPAVVTTTGSEHGLVNGNRIIIHDVLGMDEINNRELYVNRVSATQVQLYTDSSRSTALNSSGFTTYTSSGVLDQGDYANSNSYALIAGTIDADEIELGSVFFANGNPSGSNAFSNITVSGNSYQLVNFTQFNDTGAADTFAGTLGAVSSQVQIRTSTSANTDLYASTGTNGRAEGAVQIDEFTASSTNDGFITYQAGSRTFRQFQLKFIVNNTKPNEFDFTIDKFRYTIERDTINFTETVTYDGAPKTVDISSAGFLNRPVISYAILTQTDAESDPALVVTTAASATSISFKLVYAGAGSASGAYPTNSSATVMVTAIGV